MTGPQIAALVALSRAGAYLVQTMRGARVIDQRTRRTTVATGTARALIRHGWTEVAPRPILYTRMVFQISDAGRLALFEAKRRARG